MDKKTQIWVLTLIVFAGVVYGYYEYIFKSQIAEIKETEVLLQKRQSERDTLSKIKQNKQAALDKIEKEQEELDKLDKAVPDAGDLANFNIQLYYIIKDLGLDVKNVEPGNITAQKSYSSQDIRILFDGNKKDIAGFIDYLKQYPRRIKIKNAKMNIINVDQLEVDMTIQVFFIKA